MKTSLLCALLAALCCPPAIASALDAEGGDASVRPQDDLFRAVNGGWIARTRIPADKPSYGTFIQLRDLSDQRVKAIAEELAGKSFPAGTNEQKVAVFYRSYLDTAAIDKAGLAPVEPALKRISAIKTRAQLIATFGHFAGTINTPVRLGVSSDPKHPDRYLTSVRQGGLGMPDRDYYLKDDARFAKARTAYQSYLETLFQLAGDKQAAESAKRVFALEVKIAQTQWDKVENRNPVKTYNPMSVAELASRTPGIDWPLFLKTASFPKISTINLAQPSAVEAVAKMLKDEPLEVWKKYLAARVLDSSSDVLPEAFREAGFAFHGKALTGAEQPKARWQQGTAQLNAALGEAVGRIYVARHFPPEAKARMDKLVANLMRAYADSIEKLSWMSPETRIQAQDKLAHYTVKIGYPKHWQSYARLAIRDGDPLGNNQRAARFEYERQVARVNDKVDRSEWHMSPQTVNAYYNSSMNEIVFPAAILQPPFFSIEADDAFNYGAIGAVIGHEISHGFDDKGSQYDGLGRLRNWWSEADRKAFDAIGAKLIAQYEAYEPIPGQHINGHLTQGENIADLSGLQIAFKAYELSQAGKPAPVIDGLSGEQRFFLGWARAWREKSREAALLQRITADPHSPAEFRANGAAINNDAFHDAFGTKPGDRMYKAPEERIRIW
ncbi:M13 family metallopeptidase [Niveibacterium terrae]|uniref:M13 family metallopeptidase n=1 Tax=Niveibacterium terrae TaxID=3373598 RepID=UPI003A8F0121